MTGASELQSDKMSAPFYPETLSYTPYTLSISYASVTQSMNDFDTRVM